MGAFVNGVRMAQPFVNGVKMNAYVDGNRIWGRDNAVGRFTIRGAISVTPRYTVAGTSLEYSLNDGATWTPIASGSKITANGVDILMRGSGRMGLFASSSTSNAWVFTGNYIRIFGDIRDLLNYRSKPLHPGEYAFSFMFYGCTALVSPPALPATSLAPYCYYSMFQGCTALFIFKETAADRVPWCLPEAGTGVTDTGSLTNMLSGIGTGSTAPATPVINTTYYYKKF